MLDIQNDFNSDEFSLVLSGGGALGIAHLGVVHDMEEKGIVASEIVGTSMGAIVGACVAIGMREKDIYKLIAEFSSVYKWWRFSFGGNSLVNSSKVNKIFKAIFLDMKIKDAKIPLKIIATNILSGEIKVFTKNDDVKIKDALLATMAIPGVFEEKEIGGLIYCDGFLSENLGVNYASYENILAVDLFGKNSFLTKMPTHFFKLGNMADMFEKSMRIMMYNQTKVNLLNSTKNIRLLQVNTKKYKTVHFHKYKEIRKLGLGLL